MIIVTGIPRSHTSMMMQTIHNLGIECKYEIMWNKFNKKGYWECHETIHGIDTSNQDINLGIKIILNTLTKSCVVGKNDKIIFCVRHPLLACKSQINSNMGFEKMEDNLEFFERQYKYFKDWKNDKICKFLFLDTDKMLINPKQYVEKIQNFLELEFNYNTISNCINNIDICDDYNNKFKNLKTFSSDIYEEFLTWQ